MQSDKTGTLRGNCCKYKGGGPPILYRYFTTLLPLY